MRRYIVSIPMDLTSDKISKGGKATKNTEEDRWLKLKEEISKTYDGLSLELWNNHQLTTYLQRDKLQGVSRFWLGTEAITLDLLKKRFHNAKNSWLRQRYIPDLHVSALIERFVPFLYAQVNPIGIILGKLEVMRVLSEKLKLELTTLGKILKKDLEPPSKSLLLFVGQVKVYIDGNLEKVENDIDMDPFEFEDPTDYNTLFDQLRVLETDSKFHSLSYDLTPLIEEFHNLNPPDFLKDIILNLIIPFLWPSNEKIQERPYPRPSESKFPLY